MKKRNDKIEELIYLFSPVLRSGRCIDIVFSDRIGYVLLYLSNPDEADTVEMANCPEELAKTLIHEVKESFFSMTDISQKLPWDSTKTVEEYESMMTMDISLLYRNIVYYYQKEVDRILNQ